MFRRLPNRLPQDHVFPADLDKLGYFVNESDQIRQKANPNQKYQYKINRNDRVNDVYKEAMNTCTRKIVMQRLFALGLEELRLPIGAAKNQNHVSILVSKDLRTKDHIVVLFPERHTDLGILSYRVIGEENINVGSAVDFVQSLLYDSHQTSNPDLDDGIGALSTSLPSRPGLIIANPSQLTWYRGGERAVTDREWMCLPRKSAVHEPMRVDSVKNRILGNRDFREHVQYIFDNILSSHPDESPVCNPKAKISIIGLEYVGSEALQHLTSNWLSWRDRIKCVALVNPQHSIRDLVSTLDPDDSDDNIKEAEITNFIKRRVRAYRLSQRPLECLLTGRKRLGCNIYSAGETLYEENCFIRCWPSILDWINMCRVSDSFNEPSFAYGESDDETEDQPKVRAPRRVQSGKEQEEARFHGPLEVTNEGKLAEWG